GLILLTNDGELANRLAHPKYEVPKTYLVTVTGGQMYPRLLKRLLDGVDLPPAYNPRVPIERRTPNANDEGGLVRADRVKVVQTLGDKTLVEVVLHSGKNRVVRRMFDEIGRPVERLVRTRFGSIALGELKPGRTRVLGRDELGALMASVDL
ncbi:MAG: pseudouridine synthase, partial [Promicromonosporaceae bacterium]|nr:pseudouridine synthase [Promicromonosporaceae bacterium]